MSKSPLMREETLIKKMIQCDTIPSSESLLIKPHKRSISPEIRNKIKQEYSKIESQLKLFNKQRNIFVNNLIYDNVSERILSNKSTSTLNTRIISKNKQLFAKYLPLRSLTPLE